MNRGDSETGQDLYGVSVLQPRKGLKLLQRQCFCRRKTQVHPPVVRSIQGCSSSTNIRTDTHPQRVHLRARHDGCLFRRHRPHHPRDRHQSGTMVGSCFLFSRPAAGSPPETCTSSSSQGSNLVAMTISLLYPPAKQSSLGTKRSATALPTWWTG